MPPKRSASPTVRQRRKSTSGASQRKSSIETPRVAVTQTAKASTKRKSSAMRDVSPVVTPRSSVPKSRRASVATKEIAPKSPIKMSTSEVQPRRTPRKSAGRKSEAAEARPSIISTATKRAARKSSAGPVSRVRFVKKSLLDNTAFVVSMTIASVGGMN